MVSCNDIKIKVLRDRLQNIQSWLLKSQHVFESAQASLFTKGNRWDLELERRTFAGNRFTKYCNDSVDKRPIHPVPVGRSSSAKQYLTGTYACPEPNVATEQASKFNWIMNSSILCNVFESFSFPKGCADGIVLY